MGHLVILRAAGAVFPSTHTSPASHALPILTHAHVSLITAFASAITSHFISSDPWSPHSGSRMLLFLFVRKGRDVSSFLKRDLGGLSGGALLRGQRWGGHGLVPFLRLIFLLFHHHYIFSPILSVTTLSPKLPALATKFVFISSLSKCTTQDLHIVRELGWLRNGKNNFQKKFVTGNLE